MLLNSTHNIYEVLDIIRKNADIILPNKFKRSLKIPLNPFEIYRVILGYKRCYKNDISYIECNFDVLLDRLYNTSVFDTCASMAAYVTERNLIGAGHILLDKYYYDYELYPRNKTSNNNSGIEVVRIKVIGMMLKMLRSGFTFQRIAYLLSIENTILLPTIDYKIWCMIIDYHIVFENKKQNYCSIM